MVTHKTITIERVLDKLELLWGKLSETDRQAIIRRTEFRDYKKNDIIYHEGDSPSGIFCLVKGKVKIYKEGVDRKQILVAVKPYEFFGHRAFLTGVNYITSCGAFEDSTVLFLPCELTHQLMTNNPSISQFFLNHLAVLLGEQYRRIVNLTQKHIRARLAEALLFLKDNYGSEEDGFTLSIFLERKELANLSNMTTGNAIRTLSALAAEKLIAIDGRKIKVLDDKKLRKISDDG